MGVVFCFSVYFKKKLQSKSQQLGLDMSREKGNFDERLFKILLNGGRR